MARDAGQQGAPNSRVFVQNDFETFSDEPMGFDIFVGGDLDGARAALRQSHFTPKQPGSRLANRGLPCSPATRIVTALHHDRTPIMSPSGLAK